MWETSELPRSAKEKLCRHQLVSNTGATNKKPSIIVASLLPRSSFGIQKHRYFAKRLPFFVMGVSLPRSRRS
jgi:hypothetical protein